MSLLIENISRRSSISISPATLNLRLPTSESLPFRLPASPCPLPLHALPYLVRPRSSPFPLGRPSSKFPHLSFPLYVLLRLQQSQAPSQPPPTARLVWPASS